MKKILLVDDEQSIHTVYTAEFEDEGYEVISAFDGDEGLEKFSNEAVDLVILDIHMPGKTGIEVLRQMKKLKADVPVILSSAYQEYKRDLGSWASEEYIVKSGNLDDLKASVRRLLSEKK
ncbi:response regulator [Desulforhopalus singaporensis]|uniref:Response regulator receiver domain-containing protein n=1 Tax=Desulforhopalus singaporensis TaxID=91360 RepID=A0A1H0QN53_9BACT|nr:response regulator [Desulforhopalus singaporensis]SDP18783.1 Response regulator receiver domain-containing protein [Desulforhopalus singaporensis]